MASFTVKLEVWNHTPSTQNQCSHYDYWSESVTVPGTLHKTPQNKHSTRKWSSGPFRGSRVWLRASPPFPWCNKKEAKAKSHWQGQGPRQRKAQSHCLPQTPYMQVIEGHSHCTWLQF